MKTVDEICEFLQTRGVSDTVIRNVRDQKVDGAVIQMLSDEQLIEIGITALGDRCLLRGFARPAATNPPSEMDGQERNQRQNQERRQQLLDMLRRGRDRGTGRRSYGPAKRPGRPVQSERVIQFGMRLNDDNKDGGRSHQTVRSPLGDKNTIAIKLPLSMNYQDLLLKITDAFFPSNSNPVVGGRDNFSFEIVNGHNINVRDGLLESFSIQSYIKQHLIPGSVRLYLLCKPCTSVTSTLVTSETDDEDSLKDFKFTSPSSEVAFRTRAGSVASSESSGPIASTSDGRGSNLERNMQYSNLLVISDDSEDEDDEDLRTAIAASLEENRPVERNIQELLLELNAQVKRDEGPNILNIARSKILEGARRAFLRKMFLPDRPMSVKFMDDIGMSEGAIDEGGPTREFFTLLLHKMKNHGMFAGPDGSKNIVPFRPAIEQDLYYVCGQTIALAMAHISQGPHFMSTTLYDIVIKGFEVKPDISDVHPLEIRHMISEIANASTMSELERALGNAESFLDIAGCFMPVRKLEDKQKIVQSALRFQVLERNSGCIERFLEGLSVLNVRQMMRQNPDAFKSICCYLPTPLTAVTVQELFTPVLPENQRTRAAGVLAYWHDYVDDVAEGKCETSLKDIIFFATGSQTIPPVGFTPSPEVGFHSDGKYPLASTCECRIYLPLVEVDDFEGFKSNMDEGILNSVGFGRA